MRSYPKNSSPEIIREQTIKEFAEARLGELEACPGINSFLEEIREDLETSLKNEGVYQGVDDEVLDAFTKIKLGFALGFAAENNWLEDGHASSEENYTPSINKVRRVIEASSSEGSTPFDILFRVSQHGVRRSELIQVNLLEPNKDALGGILEEIEPDDILHRYTKTGFGLGVILRATITQTATEEERHMENFRIKVAAAKFMEEVNPNDNHEGIPDMTCQQDVDRVFAELLLANTDDWSSVPEGDS